MLNSGIKRLLLFMILLYSFLSNTGYTDADIFAERVVSQNKFSAMTLDFSTKNSFNNSPVNSLFHSLGIQPGGFDLGSIRLKNESNGKAKYYLKTVQTNGDDNFCKNLHLKILNRNFLPIFSGNLLDASLTSSLDGSKMKDYIFFISLDDNDSSLQNKICEFNFDFHTYHENPDEQGGIFAQRLVGNVISSGNW
jgi:hypothetical protein